MFHNKVNISVYAFLGCRKIRLSVLYIEQCRYNPLLAVSIDCAAPLPDKPPCQRQCHPSYTTQQLKSKTGRLIFQCLTTLPTILDTISDGLKQLKGKFDYTPLVLGLLYLVGSFNVIGVMNEHVFSQRYELRASNLIMIA